MCGNRVTETLEFCDDGADTVLCDDDCTTPMCGDGHVNEPAGEQCEPPGINFCDSECQSTF